MKFEKSSSKNIENTSDRDTAEEMKREADEMNHLLESIDLGDHEESPASSSETLPRFNEAEARRRVEERKRAIREQRMNREAHYGVDQEAVRREEKSEGIRNRLHSINAGTSQSGKDIAEEMRREADEMNRLLESINLGDYEEPPTDKTENTPSQTTEQSGNNSVQSEGEEMKKTLEELKESIGGIFG